MALRGNLKELSLPDIFQLVTFSRKTGVLRIRQASGAEGSVWFRDGDVFFAQSNWRTELLGERLVRGQRITPMALDRALELRAQEPEGGLRLGEILVREGYITDKVLEAFVQEQMQDTIFDLMRWDEGDFEFEAMPDAPDEDIGLSVSIENVIMEGSRRLDEWNRIKKKIPSMDIVFKMATAPGEGTYEISLKPVEWNLLLLVDGSRSVAELAQETTRTDFEVARIIYGLFSAGLLEFSTDEEVAASRAERKERETKFADLLAQRPPVTLEPPAPPQAPAPKVAEPAPAGEKGKAQPKSSAAAAGTPSVAPEKQEVSGEEPVFLGNDLPTASADDVAMLEAAMGAVLDATAPPTQPAVIKPAEPYVPGEEPAFIAASQDAEPGESQSAQSVEELLADIPGLASAAVAPEGQAVDLEPAPVEEATAEVAPAAAPEPAVEAVPAAEVAPPPVEGEALVEAPAEPVAVAEEPPAEPLVEAPAEPVAVAEEPPAEPLVEAAEPLAAVEQLAEAQPAEAIEASLPTEVTEGEPVLSVGSRDEVVAEPLAQPAEPQLAEPQAAEAPETAEPQVAEAQPAEPQLAEPQAAEAPETAEPQAAEAEPVMEVAEPPSPEPVGEAVEVAQPPEQPEPPVEAPSAAPEEGAPAPAPSVGLEDFENDLMALGLGELPAELRAPEEGESAAAHEDLDLEPVVEPMSLGSPPPAQGADFSELLESLDISADDARKQGDAAADLSVDAILGESEPKPAGVISTDAYMDDLALEADGLGFSGELTDELSALTGAERHARPSASVNKLPAEGEALLHRDSRVDRDTLLKIIDGIKNL